jgi:hypothetical protein
MPEANYPQLAKYTREIEKAFKATDNKRAALARTVPILQDMSGEPRVLSEILKKHVLTPGALSKKHYPVVGIDVLTTPSFGLVANCWIPLPNHETDLSTKSIHHHGDMLLNTVTAFGPGYEHWIFTRPELVDRDQELFAMQVLERAPHPLHHVGFVDSYLPHVPFYPSALTITVALWSSQRSVTWKDRMKRWEVFKGRERTLREIAVKVGLRHALDLKVVEYFDYYPADQAFKGIRQRTEFSLGPNSDYLHSLFHIVQRTGNEALAPVISLQMEPSLPDYQTAVDLLGKLKRGVPIEGRLSDSHYGIPNANFTGAQIERALSASAKLVKSASA